MKQHLTERSIKAMVPEIDRDVLVYDEEVTGFAICVYRSGKRAFVLRYRIAGRSRHFTIGSWPDWSVTAARDDAKRLKREVDAGNDPLGNRIDHRNAPTMAATRAMPVMLFRFAPRMHDGAFLSPDEVPAILQRGERVLNRDETRRYNSGERGGQPSIYVTIQTPSPAAFQASRTQLAADLSRAVQMGLRGR